QAATSFLTTDHWPLLPATLLLSCGAATMSVSRTISRLDLNLLTTALLIAAIGCLLVYSATYFGPEAPLFRKQVMWTLIGIALLILFIAIDYHLLMEVAPFLYGVGLVLLAYLLASDRLTRHVKSWIHSGAV